MTFKRRNLVWMIPLLLIVSFPIWKIPVGKFLTPRGGYDPSYANVKTNIHNFNMETVTIVQHQKGKKSAVVRAATAYTGDKPHDYILEQVNADIFNLDGEATNVIAKRGIFNTETELLTLMDDVVVDKQIDNQQLYTDLLYYDDKQRTVKCPGPTKLVGEGVEINGTSLDYDVNLGQYEIGGRVHCTINGFSEP